MQKFYSGLQALALNEDEPERVEDLLEPDYEGLKKFDNVMNHFRGTFYNGAMEDPECAEKPKRAAGGAGRGRGRGAGAGRGAANAGGASGGLKDRKIVDVGSSASSASGKSSAAGRGRGRRGNSRNNMPQIPEENDSDDELQIDHFENGKKVVKKRKLNGDETEIPMYNNSLSQKSKLEGNGGRVQAPRSSQPGSKMTIDDKFKLACRDGSIKNYKVAELREFLTLKSMPTNGQK